MATKDWKKFGSKRWVKKNVRIVIGFWDGGDEYIVDIADFKNQKSIAFKGFDTKPKALKFAMKYMRTH